MEYGGSAKVVSEGSRISHWARGHSRDILVKNVSALCPYEDSYVLRIFLRLKLRKIGLISLSEEISRQPNSDHAVWLSVGALMQVHSEKASGVERRPVGRKMEHQGAQGWRSQGCREDSRARRGLVCLGMEGMGLGAPPQPSPPANPASRNFLLLKSNKEKLSQV